MRVESFNSMSHIIACKNGILFCCHSTPTSLQGHLVQTVAQTLRAMGVVMEETLQGQVCNVVGERVPAVEG